MADAGMPLPSGPSERSRGPRAVLVLGDPGALSDAVVNRLAVAGTAAESFAPSGDTDAKELLLEDRWTAVAVVTRDDVLALRLTLLCAHVRPDVPLWTTLFDRTVVHQLRGLVPSVHILSPADLVAAELVKRCLAVGARPVSTWRRGVRLVDDALRLLTAAGAGLAAVLLVQVVISLIALHENLVEGVFFSARALATIADSPEATGAPAWFKIVATVTALVAVVLLAVFTAALVRRLSRPRLTTLLGPRAAPARGHVVMVGFGQVGFRLAQGLIERGVPILGVERDVAAPCVRLARRAGIPVMIAEGEDLETLELVGVRHAVAVAAVTSDDLVNVAVGLAVADAAQGVPVVLRLGDGEVAAETESLLHLGEICDLHDVAAREIARQILGTPGSATH